MMLLAATMVGGCAHPAVPASPDAAAPPPDLAEAPLPVVSALRCEECHVFIAARWRTSAHARADRAPLYLAMRTRAPSPAGCDRCHAPFAGHAGAGEPGAHEGVNCDTCHSIRQVEPARGGAGFTLESRENTKYGPLCDARDHYFHKMGCSPLHGQGRFCAACHLYYRTLAGGAALPVFTEYEEWRDGPAAAEGLECQSCHMPGVKHVEVARGWKPPRPLAHDHGLLGVDGKLRRRALKLRLDVARAAEHVTVEAILSNVGAGHAVPGGLPGRRVVLRLVGLDGAGHEQARAEREYARVLADDAGREQPFYAATHLLRDDRLLPGTSRHERFDLTAPSARVLLVQLLWRAAPAAWRSELGAGADEEELLLETRIPLPAPGNAGAARTRTVTLEPVR